MLALVAGQDVEPADGSDGTHGRWMIARKVAHEAVISSVDRHTRKSRSRRRDGYRAHLAAEPDTGLITEFEMTMATGQDNTDAAVGVKMAGRDGFHPTTEPAAAENDGGHNDGGHNDAGLETHGELPVPSRHITWFFAGARLPVRPAHSIQIARK